VYFHALVTISLLPRRLKFPVSTYILIVERFAWGGGKGIFVSFSVSYLKLELIFLAIPSAAKMVRLAGLEPATPGLGILCSIHLS
jgi:hypothetical protein